MDERKKKVLQAIIQDYIENAEPVGSRAVAKKYDLGVSPATIRNEMSDLEDLGYIEQPHTSAGRVPSDKGYRYYVDNLMDQQSLTAQEMAIIKEAFAIQLTEMDDFMRSCCQLIAKLTNYTTMISMPERNRGILQKLQLVPINEQQILVILLAESGIVQHKIINIEQSLPPNVLQRVEMVLQSRLIGMEIDKLNYEFIRNELREIEQHQRHLDQAMSLLKQIFKPSYAPKVFTGGTTQMLSQPEFRDIDRLKSIFSLLEEDNKISELLPNKNIDNPVSIIIGNEIAEQDIQNCSMIVAYYDINGKDTGKIGVLGPTRMSYNKTVALMDFIAKELTRKFSGK